MVDNPFLEPGVLILPANDSPPDLMFLLGSINATVGTIAIDTRDIKDKLKDHDSRLGSVEQQIAATTARATGWYEAGGFIKGLIIAFVGIIGYLGYHIAVTPTPSVQETQAKTVITRSVMDAR